MEWVAWWLHDDDLRPCMASLKFGLKLTLFCDVVQKKQPRDPVPFGKGTWFWSEFIGM